MTIIEALEAVNEAATKQLNTLKSDAREYNNKEDYYHGERAEKEADGLKQAIEIVEGLTPMIKIILDK